MKWSSAIVGLLAATICAPASAAVNNVEISGLVEVEAVNAEDYAGGNTTDITLSTVELDVDATLQNLISAHVGFLYEEDQTDFSLDEGTITLGPNAGKSFVFGKMYLPFARYDTFMISDPQTLALSEFSETVMMLAVDDPAGYGSIYLFNGDSEESSVVAAGDDDTISGGVSIGRRDAGRYDLGVEYITNIADSDILQELGTTTQGEVKSSVPGVNVHLVIHSGNTTFLAEQVMALESFSNGDLGGTVTNEEQPVVTNIELGIIQKGGAIVAFGYQMTEEAQFIGLPETVMSLVMRKAVMPGASMALEYAQMEDYSVNDGGTGKTANVFTLQIAMNF